MKTPLSMILDGLQSLKSGLKKSSRGQSIPASHAFLITLILTTTFGIAAVGSDAILGENADLSQTVMTDEFEAFEDSIDSILDSKEPRRASVGIPAGEFYVSQNDTQITIDDGSESIELNTTLFEFIPRGSNQIVIYESGLVSQRERPEGSPVISKYPKEMYTNPSGTDAVYTLRLIEHNVTESTAIKPTLRREFVYNVYPRNSSRRSYDYSAADDVSITVTSPNHEAWEAYFNGGAGTAATMYTDVESNEDTADPNTVRADIKSNTRFRLRVDRVTMFHPIRQT